MVMRFRGGGVGHASTRVVTDVFKIDRDVMDISSRDSRREQHAEARDDENQDTGDIDGDQNLGSEDEELSESELVDYGYEEEVENDSEDEKSEDDNAKEDEGDEDIVEDLAALGYAEF